ncbi:MAG: preprotein translocase subunit YajC [Actinomycetaceae bacterium]|nr:preprotein translocase subunit YajC [Actinomycetaceae bacterium]
MLLLLVMMAALMFFSSRGRKKQQEQMEQMHRDIELGSWVRTASGYYGIVADVDGDVYILQSPSGDETYWDRRAISMIAEPPFESTLSEGEVDEETLPAGDEPALSEPAEEVLADEDTQSEKVDEAKAEEPAEDLWDESFTKSDKPRDEAQ